MKLQKKILTSVLSVSMLAAAFAGTAMAAEEREKISSVELTVDSNVEVGDESGDVIVTTGDSRYSVEDVELVNDMGEWNNGDVPQVAITLEARSNYYFASMSSSKVKLRGDDAKYVKSRREDSSSTLIVTIKLDALVGSLDLEDVYWEDEESTIARWEQADGAKSYQVRLYRGSSSVGETVTTSGTSYNFASRITREGEYYFKVRSVGTDDSKGEWYESDYIYVDDQMLEDIRAGRYGSTGAAASPAPNTSANQWIKDNVGWWYRFADGSYPTNGWLLINNVWYCFDHVGYMRTGWIESSGLWYYCHPESGAMMTNTTIDGKYYVNSQGVWVQ